MHHALEVLFDSGAESLLSRIWSGLRDAGLDATMIDLGARPHVTLAVYDAPLLGDAEAEIAAFCEQEVPVTVTLSSVGSFPGDEGVVFLAPVVTRELLDLHARWHEHFTRWREAVWPYYLPGAWVPHCTMGFHVAPRLLPAAIEFVRTANLPIRGTLARASVLEFDSTSPASLRSRFAVPLGEGSRAEK